MAASDKLAFIHEALFKRIETEAEALGVAVAYPNAEFDADLDSSWYIETRIFPNTPKSAKLARGQVMDQGLLSLAAVYAKNTGAIAPLNSAEALKQMFPMDLELFNGGFKVKVVSEPWIGSPIVEPDRYLVPVTVEWVS